MKTAISIPDPLYRKAEREAKRRGLTRSRLYAVALQKYLQDASDDEITEKLNEVYSKEDSRLDPALCSYVRKKLSATEW